MFSAVSLPAPDEKTAISLAPGLALSLETTTIPVVPDTPVAAEEEVVELLVGIDPLTPYM